MHVAGPATVKWRCSRDATRDHVLPRVVEPDHDVPFQPPAGLMQLKLRAFPARIESIHEPLDVVLVSARDRPELEMHEVSLPADHDGLARAVPRIQQRGTKVGQEPNRIGTVDQGEPRAIGHEHLEHAGDNDPPGPIGAMDGMEGCVDGHVPS